MKYKQCYQSKINKKDGCVLYTYNKKKVVLHAIESEIYEYFNGINTMEQIANAIYPLFYSNLTKEEFIETFNSYIVYLTTNHLLIQNNH